MKSSARKPNKILIDKVIEIYPTYNKGKSAVTEWSIKALKNKIYKHDTTTSENM